MIMLVQFADRPGYHLKPELPGRSALPLIQNSPGISQIGRLESFREAIIDLCQGPAATLRFACQHLELTQAGGSLQGDNLLPWMCSPARLQAAAPP